MTLAHMHTQDQSQTPHTCTHRHYTYTHMCVHPTCAHIHTCTGTDAHSHACTYTHVHTDIHAHTHHTCTHKHTQPDTQQCRASLVWKSLSPGTSVACLVMTGLMVSISAFHWDSLVGVHTPPTCTTKDQNAKLENTQAVGAGTAAFCFGSV